MGHPGKSCLAKGGGLDMIYAGKGFSVECLFEQPDPETIIYTNNPENDYLKAQHHRQQTVLDRLGPGAAPLCEDIPPPSMINGTMR